MMLEMQFATGAKSARPAHKQAKHYMSWKEAKAAVAALMSSYTRPRSVAPTSWVAVQWATTRSEASLGAMASSTIWTTSTSWTAPSPHQHRRQSTALNLRPRLQTLEQPSQAVPSLGDSVGAVGRDENLSLWRRPVKGDSPLFHRRMNELTLSKRGLSPFLDEVL